MQERKDEIGHIALDKLPDLVLSGISIPFTITAAVTWGVIGIVFLAFLGLLAYLLHHRFVTGEFTFFGPNKGFHKPRRRRI